MHVWSTAPGQACLSLFDGLCSHTLPPSNYVYIELSARLDASPHVPLSAVSKARPLL